METTIGKLLFGPGPAGNYTYPPEYESFEPKEKVTFLERALANSASKEGAQRGPSKYVCVAGRFTLVGDRPTGRQIKDAYCHQHGFHIGKPYELQLQAMMPNGSNRVVGDDEVPLFCDFDLISTMDNA